MKNIYMTTIGNEIIHAEQCQAGEVILSLLTPEEECVPVLVAQPQQGKTGSATYVLDRFIKTAKINRKSFRVLYVTNMSDKDLREQVEERMEQAWLDDDVEVLHLDDLDNHEVEETDYTLIITDECHYAIDADRRFHKFLLDYGIQYGKPRSEWKNRNVFLLPISATPFAHVIHGQNHDGVFSLVPLPMNEAYYSLSDAWEADRLHQSEDLIIGKNRPTKFLTTMLDSFLDSCDEDDPGYFIIRHKGTKQQALRDYIKSTYPKIRVRGYSTKAGEGDHPISRLDKTLQIVPEVPTVVLIRDSMRAGKTLTTTKNIRGWYESSNSKADAMLQSIGRSLGYASEDGHSKFHDLYPIYCNTREVEESIDFYDDLAEGKYNSMIPSGIRNKSTTHKNRYNYEQIPFDSMPTIQEIREAAQGIGVEVLETEVHFHRTSTQEATPAIRQLTDNDGYQQGKAGAVTVYHVDGHHANYYGDWQILNTEKPHLIGKFVALVKSGRKKKKNFDSLISNKAIFREN
jgi:hypothetical protein